MKKKLQESQHLKKGNFYELQPPNQLLIANR